MRALQGVLQRLRLMPSTKRRITILHSMRGVLKPGRLTLLLGPPSSGKTTLLKALSGKLPGKGGDLQARKESTA
jgi:ABC-type multidrug transport system ATPase subunit